MNRRPLPDQAYLRECLSFEAESGRLIWRARPLTHFSDGKLSAQHRCNSWNGAYAGRDAFTATSPNGYGTGGLDRVIYRAHRIIWKLVHGEEPDDIDHIDGNRRNNRLSNLRRATRQENMRNARLRSDNRSGIVGVHYNEKKGRWIAQIKGGKKQCLGWFKTRDEAIAARVAAERELGFHQNHGRKSPQDAHAFLKDCGAPCKGEML